MHATLVKVGAAMLLGIGFGTYGGHSAVSSLTPRVAPDAIETEEAAYRPDEQRFSTRDQAIADACFECSDYDLGYRWAAAAQVRTTSECLDYSWSYQRGCLAWLRRS